MNEAERNLVWFDRQRRKSGNDVTITVNYDAQSHKGRYVGFTFRNDSYKKFAEESAYFELAFFKNRMFFKKSDSAKGLLLQANRETPNRYAKVQSDNADYFTHWGGDYKLQYDEFWDLYYIERKDED